MLSRKRTVSTKSPRHQSRTVRGLASRTEYERRELLRKLVPRRGDRAGSYEETHER